jgi:hypothetical protein
MPANDAIHDAVVRALAKDGWSITDDPLTVEFGDLYLFIDLAGERALAARRGDERIAVEIKSFSGRSKVADLQQAVGQFVVYRAVLGRVEPERVLYLAVSSTTYEQVFQTPAGEAVSEDLELKLIVVDLETEEVSSWIT